MNEKKWALERPIKKKKEKNKETMSEIEQTTCPYPKRDCETCPRKDRLRREKEAEQEIEMELRR